MKNIAIIPARSGSKGLKDKNIKNLCGKPMIAYSIEAAIQSGQFDMIYVSTDSERYASIAIEHGAEVPFLRSAELGGDQIGTWDVVQDAIRNFEKKGEFFDTITVLQPTTPLREAGDIIAGFQLLAEKQGDAVVAVCEMEHSPLWSNTLGDDLCMDQFIDKNILLKPRQMLPSYYRVNGAIYLLKRNRLEEIDKLYNDQCYALVMPGSRSIDIDCELDFRIAEQIMMKQYEENIG